MTVILTSFRMNEYRRPIEIRRDVTVYTLERNLVVTGSLGFYVVIDGRVIAQVHSDDDGTMFLSNYGQRDGCFPNFASCNWDRGVVYLGWLHEPVPDHELCCCYEYMCFPDEPAGHYIPDAANVTVNWLKEGF